ncbi:MAG: SIS domain-containing protein [Bacteroidales bacterium]|nr:MAG: SIS domain-containing protein [Bacteroidales bacterium]
MSGHKHFTEYFKQVSDVLTRIDVSELEAVANSITECYNREGMIYIFGNGGSSATATHVAGDYLKAITFGMDKRLKIICLSDNTPGLMAIANDISYDDIFVEQLKSFIKSGDLVIGISGSGNSENVLRALKLANDRKVETVALVGFSGGKAKSMVDICVHIPINDMEMTEDLHLLCFHAIKQHLINTINITQSGMGDKYNRRMKEC